MKIREVIEKLNGTSRVFDFRPVGTIQSEGMYREYLRKYEIVSIYDIKNNEELKEICEFSKFELRVCLDKNEDGFVGIF